MSEKCWTPGPWQAMPHGRVVGSRTKELTGGTVRCQVAMATANEIEVEEQTANSHLIAAAPELYEALREQLVWTTSGPCQLPMVNPCRCVACKSHRANAALAKARGEA